MAFQLRGEELTHVGRLQRGDHYRLVGEACPEQAPHNTNAIPARPFGQASHTVHVLVETL